MEETLNVVNDTQSETVDTQQTEPTEQVSSTTNEWSEVVDTQVGTKPVQDAETNRQYAEIRRKAEVEAKDKVIAEMYGEQGITTYAQYQQAIAEQQAEEQRQQYQEQYGIDPNAVQPLIDKALENHPAVQAAKAQERTLTLNNAAMELSKVAKSLGINEEIKSWEDVEKLPKWESIKQGVVNNNLDIVTAAKLAYFDDVVNQTSTKAQQEAIAKISANGQSSPGSLGSNSGEVDQSSIYSLGKTDFNSMVDQVLRGERKKL